MLVVLTHVSEALHLFPWMHWGDEHSLGHYLDFGSAVLGLTLSLGISAPCGYEGRRVSAAKGQGRPYRQQYPGIWLMMASRKLAVFTIVFVIAYAVIYVICTEMNLPLLTYHPVIGEVDFLWTPERRGPAMYWYGWMLTSLIGAVALAAIATAVPASWVQRVILFGCLAAVAYLVLYTLAFVPHYSANASTLEHPAIASYRDGRQRQTGWIGVPLRRLHQLSAHAARPQVGGMADRGARELSPAEGAAG